MVVASFVRQSSSLPLEKTSCQHRCRRLDTVQRRLKDISAVVKKPWQYCCMLNYCKDMQMYGKVQVYLVKQKLSRDMLSRKK